MIVIGDLVLRPLSRGDEEFIVVMRNRPEVYENSLYDPPFYDFAMKAFFEESVHRRMDFIIEMRLDRAGWIYLEEVDYRHQRAGFGIALLPSYEGRGIAYAASKLFFDYVFHHLPIHKVHAQLLADSQRALKLYRKLGFVEEGRFSRELYKGGRWRDVLRLALFKDAWLSTGR